MAGPCLPASQHVERCSTKGSIPGGPQIDPILIVGIPKKGTLMRGNPQIRLRAPAEISSTTRIKHVLHT